MSAESLDLDKIAARADAATPGPWYVDMGGDFGDRFWQIADVLRDPFGNNAISSSDKPTIDFIAAAREDVPALVAALRVARHQLDAVRDIRRRFMAGAFPNMRELLHALDAALSSVPDPQEQQ